MKDARRAPDRPGLAAHREAIAVLRQKGYTWREIADFLRERGIAADHTAIYRFMRKEKPVPPTFAVPPASKYAVALQSLEMNDKERAMLRAHFLAPNRTVTYSELAAAAGFRNHGGANRRYGGLGRRLGEELGMRFFGEHRGEPFYSSSLGMGYKPDDADFQLMMHHELAKAIEQLGWFK